MNLESTLFAFLGGLLLSSILFFLLTFLSKQSRGKRIKLLTQAANRFTKGDLAETITLEFKDEFKELADAMNQMAFAIKERIADIQGEQTKTSTILENMLEGVIAVDSNKKVLLTNPSADFIFNLKKGLSTGKNVLEVVRNPKIDQILDQAIKKQTMVTEEIEVHLPERKILRANAVGIPKRESNLSGILVFYNITEIKKLERLRQDFVANVSHELKTPLTSIKGFIETLSAEALAIPDRAKGFLKMMEGDAERLTRLIGDLLELSKIESKEAKLKLEPINLKEEIDKVLATFESRIREKGITVKNQVNFQVQADRDRLKQILINLIENAIKFNQSDGQIIFQSEPLGDQIKISVEDTGIGIPGEMTSRIFERFFRVDKARSRELGGTGLGLSIVKHLVEAHGGAVWCESEVDGGSKFFFTLPIAHFK
ncbi:MAG: HAMP domain-containing protein [Candidatus Omnitrophica bacterium]|nr:HAMP domain-containing protein [Candidatus Omnitrophota bacterium]